MQASADLHTHSRESRSIRVYGTARVLVCVSTREWKSVPIKLKLPMNVINNYILGFSGGFCTTKLEAQLPRNEPMCLRWWERFSSQPHLFNPLFPFLNALKNIQKFVRLVLCFCLNSFLQFYFWASSCCLRSCTVKIITSSTSTLLDD